MKRSLKISLALGAVGALLSLMSATSGCIDFDEPDGSVRATTILAPDQTDFENVSPVLERRCGTLDCHGQVGRPLRIYSGLGLRLPNDAGNLPGTGATTPDEVTTNYRTVIGLEPEEMTRVIALEDPPTALLLLKKPLMLEAHKGGPAFAPSGDPGEICITTWIQGAADKNACNQAIAGF